MVQDNEKRAPVLLASTATATATATATTTRLHRGIHGEIQEQTRKRKVSTNTLLDFSTKFMIFMLSISMTILAFSHYTLILMDDANFGRENDIRYVDVAVNSTIPNNIASETLTTKSANSASSEAKIPHRLVFLDTRYDSIHSIPSPFKENVQHTIDTYRNFWKNQETIVEYLGDEACKKVIAKVEDRLTIHYLNEKKGQNKANICRIATLYDKGGYYFDTDMQVVKAVDIGKDVTFMTPHEAKSSWHNVPGFFNSFIAVMPGHPMLRINLDIFVQYYQENDTKGDNDKKTYKGQHFPLLGTASLFTAYKEFNELQDIDKNFWSLDLSLSEVRLNSGLYPSFPRHKGKGCCCDFVVHNEREKEIYFYSRIVGADPWCSAL